MPAFRHAGTALIQRNNLVSRKEYLLLGKLELGIACIVYSSASKDIILYLHSGKLAQVPAQSHPAPHVLLEGGTDQPVLHGKDRILPQQQREQKHLPARTARTDGKPQQRKKKEAVKAEQTESHNSHSRRSQVALVVGPLQQ